MQVENEAAPVQKDRLIPRELYKPVYDESFEDVCKNLSALSNYLIELLPDPSLSPDERIERLARVVPDSTLVSVHHRTARTKLKAIRARLQELVPGEGLTDMERIEFLVNKVHTLVPGDQRLFLKLEAIGDYRGSDMGR